MTILRGASSLSPEEVVALHEGLAYNFARQYANRITPMVDLLQEGRIALWRAAVKKPGDDLTGVASYILKRRIIEVSMSGAMLADRPSGGAGKRNEVQITGSIDSADSVAERDNLLAARGVTNESADSVVVRAQTVNSVREALALLPTRQQRVVAHAKLRGDHARETAHILGCSESTVRNIWNRDVVPALREALKDWGIEHDRD